MKKQNEYEPKKRNKGQKYRPKKRDNKMKYWQVRPLKSLNER